MNRYERHSELLRLLSERRSLEVESAAEEMDVSAATIRRDLDQLAEQKLLTRTRGGAVRGDVSYDLPLRYKSVRDSAEKERIGRAAAAMVEPGTVVGLNGGTTTTEVARALGVRTDWGAGGPEDSPSVTVVTNALNIAHELAVRSHVKVVATGGVAMPRSYELVGPLAGHILREVSLDVAFLGVNALDPRGGASARNEQEASINSLLAAQAKRVVVVADSSKLGVRAFARICGTDGIDALVTDSRAPGLCRAFEERGVTVTQV